MKKIILSTLFLLIGVYYSNAQVIPRATIEQQLGNSNTTYDSLVVMFQRNARPVASDFYTLFRWIDKSKESRLVGTDDIVDESIVLNKINDVAVDYLRSLANATGSLPQSKVTGLEAELASIRAGLGNVANIADGSIPGSKLAERYVTESEQTIALIGKLGPADLFPITNRVTNLESLVGSKVSFSDLSQIESRVSTAETDIAVLENSLANGALNLNNATGSLPQSSVSGLESDLDDIRASVGAGGIIPDNSITPAKLSQTYVTPAEQTAALANKIEISDLTPLDNRVSNIESDLPDKLEAADLTPLTTRVSTVEGSLNGKQETLVSGVNLSSINGQSLLSGNNITITGGSGGVPDDGSVSEVKLTPELLGKINAGSQSDFFVRPTSLQEAQTYINNLPAGKGATITLKNDTIYRGQLIINRNNIKITADGASPVRPGVYASKDGTGLSWSNQGGGVWRADVQSLLAGDSVYGLWVNNQRAILAKSQLYEIASFNVGLKTITATVTLPTLTGARAYYRTNQWTEVARLVTAGSGSTAEVGTFFNRSATGFRYEPVVGGSIVFDNRLDFLDENNEYFYDGNQYLYYHAGTNPNGLASIEISTAEQVIFLDGELENVTIENLDIRYGGHDNIATFDVQKDITVQNNRINRSGRAGISLVNSNNTIPHHNERVKILNNEIRDHNGFGLLLYNMEEMLVEGNTIDSVGQGLPTGAHDLLFNYPDNYNVGISLENRQYNVPYVGRNNTIRKNTVTNIAWSGMRTNGKNILVEYNDVSDYLTELADGGGLYTNGDTRNLGQIWQYNKITKSTGDLQTNTPIPYHAAGSGIRAGIYLDNTTRNVMVRYNYVDDAGSGAVVKGKFNTLEHNLFIPSANGVGITWLEEVIENRTPEGIIIKDNVLVATRPNTNTFHSRWNPSTVPSQISTFSMGGNAHVSPYNESSIRHQTGLQGQVNSWTIAQYQREQNRAKSDYVVPIFHNQYAYTNPGTNKFANSGFDTDLSGVGGFGDGSKSQQDTAVFGTGPVARQIMPPENEGQGLNRWVVQMDNDLVNGQEYLFSTDIVSSEDAWYRVNIRQNGDRLVKFLYTLKDQPTKLQFHYTHTEASSTDDQDIWFEFYPNGKETTYYVDNFTWQTIDVGTDWLADSLYTAYYNHTDVDKQVQIDTFLVQDLKAIAGIPLEPGESTLLYGAPIERVVYAPLGVLVSPIEKRIPYPIEHSEYIQLDPAERRGRTFMILNAPE